MIPTTTTKLAGSIAAKQSDLGPIIHHAGYDHLGLDYLYLPLEVSDGESAIEAIRALNFVGVAVSMPFKQEVMQYLDEIEPVAKEIRAVNTVVREGAKLVGYNSDWIGALNALSEVTDLKDKQVAVIGAGGAARAIVYALRKSGAHVTIYNRTAEDGKGLAEAFGQEFGGTPADLTRSNAYDIVINATSVGFKDPESRPVIDLSVLESKPIVFDVVFSPLETPLLKAARDKGCLVVPGYRMLLHQALFQFEKFTGKKAPIEVMERALREALTS